MRIFHTYNLYNCIIEAGVSSYNNTITISVNYNDSIIKEKEVSSLNSIL